MKMTALTLLLFRSINSAVLEKGNIKAVEVILPKTSHVYTEVFISNLKASVTLKKFQNYNMRMIVTDFRKNTICDVNIKNGYSSCVWTPSWTGHFNVEIVNESDKLNKYEININ